MTDERQRELAREAVQGDADAHARLLRERLRSGDLTEAQVQLLANLGHAPARAALGDPAPITDLGKWIEALPRVDVVRASATLARAALEMHERRPAPLGAGRQGLSAVDAWTRHPGPSTAAACKQAAMTLMAALNTGSVLSAPEEPERLARSDANPLGEATPAERALLTCVLLTDAPSRATAAAAHFALQMQRVFRCAEPILPAGGTFRDAVCAELLPGALAKLGD